jgi:VIT1/CCC1 family predicted Fe2+/Mn2+ transporter
MKQSFKTGLCFGLTSGVITTLGLMVGLYSSTKSQMVVIGGILTIALADSFADSMGIHVSQESEKNYCKRDIWEATIYTLLSKIFFSSIFIIPVLFLELKKAIMISVLIGFYLLIITSISIARERKENPWYIVGEHLIISIIVIIITYYLGNMISIIFN